MLVHMKKNFVRPVLKVLYMLATSLLFCFSIPEISWEWPFPHHNQGSIDFNTVNIHRTVGMYFLISTGNRGDIEWHDLQRSYYPICHHQKGRIDFNTVNPSLSTRKDFLIHSLPPGVYVSILSLGIVFPRTLPMANIRNTSSRGTHWQCSGNDAE